MKDRERALMWWHKLSQSLQETYFFDYIQSNFSPATMPKQLTGREVQKIFENLNKSL